MYLIHRPHTTKAKIKKIPEKSKPKHETKIVTKHQPCNVLYQHKNARLANLTHLMVIMLGIGRRKKEKLRMKGR